MNLQELDAPIKPTPPERIYHWQQSQMSIARYFGGLAYEGHHYTIAVNEEGTPLVRADVLEREAKAARDAAKTKRDAEKQAAQAAQGDLL